MNRNFIARHWYACMYEQIENQTNDVKFLIGLLREHSSAPLNILEAACGGGRICVPLARAGHNVTGFDADEHMLLRCYRHMRGLPNLRCGLLDVESGDWGAGYYVALLAGNLLINLETPMDYAQAQRLLIRNAASALRPGGYLYLDFDLHYNPAKVFDSRGESSYFEGTDDLGTYGRTMSYGSVYNPVTQICTGANHVELTLNNGERFTVVNNWHKHIPTQAQVYAWLKEAGLAIEKTYKNYTGEPLAQPIDESTHRATIWARRDR